MDHKILALGGDGIGPEVLDLGLRLIYKIQDIFGINIKIEHDLIAVSYTHLRAHETG